MKRRAFLAFALFLAFAGALFADLGSGDTDQIFQAPPPDIQAPSPDTQAPLPDLPNPLERFTTQTGIKLRGSFDSYAGFLLGWSQLPDPNNLANGFSKSPTFGLASSVSFEARPNARFRVLGTLIENYPNTSTTPVSYTDVTPPTIAELFCDYTISDILFFRIGKQIITWGGTRFFPFDDLPARVPVSTQSYSERFDNSAAIGLRMTVPLGIHTVSGIAQVRSGYFANPAVPHLEEVGFGLTGDFVFGNADLSLNGYYQKYLSPRVLALAKTTLWGIDARAGAMVADVAGSGATVSWLANGYWEQPDVKFRVMVEYIYNAEQAQPYTASSNQPGYSIDSQQLYGIGTEPGYPSGHAVSALAGFKNIFGTNIDVGLQWEHVFSDNSGVVIPAILFRPFDLVTITLGVPLYYGSPTADIMELNPDPLKRQTALGLKLDISSSF